MTNQKRTPKSYKARPIKASTWIKPLIVGFVLAISLQASIATSKHQTEQKTHKLARNRILVLGSSSGSDKSPSGSGGDQPPSGSGGNPPPSGSGGQNGSQNLQPQPDPNEKIYNYPQMIRIRTKDRNHSLWLNTTNATTSALFTPVTRLTKQEGEVFHTLSFNFLRYLKEYEFPASCRIAYGSTNPKPVVNFALQVDLKCLIGDLSQVLAIEETKIDGQNAVKFKAGCFPGGRQCLYVLIRKGDSIPKKPEIGFQAQESAKGKTTSSTILMVKNDLNNTGYDLIRDRQNFSISIKSVRKNASLLIDKSSTLALRSIIKLPIHRQGLSPLRPFEFSLKLNGYLSESEVPSTACANIYKNNLQTKFNYMLGNDSICAYGTLDKVSNIVIRNITRPLPQTPSTSLKMPSASKSTSYSGTKANLPRQQDTLVTVYLNGFMKEKNHMITLNLFPLDYIGSDEVANSTFIVKDGVQKVVDQIYVHMDLNQDYKIGSIWGERNMAFSIGLILMLIPMAGILAFRRECKMRGFYWMQFGVNFYLISQVMLSIVDWFGLEGLWLVQILLIGLSVMGALLGAQSRHSWVILAWQIYGVIDYFLMAGLMEKGPTVFYSLINFVLFFVMAGGYKYIMPETMNHEILVSLVASLTFLNLLGNIWFFTTFFNRLVFMFFNYEIHDYDPFKFYIYYGGFFNILGIVKLFLNEALHWNAEAARSNQKRPELHVKNHGMGDISLDDGLADIQEEIESESLDEKDPGEELQDAEGIDFRADDGLELDDERNPKEVGLLEGNEEQAPVQVKEEEGVEEGGEGADPLG